MSADSCSLNGGLSEPGPKSYLICPYDKHHCVLPIRLATHLIKCARNHPISRMVQCPFNTTHLMQSANLQEHLRNCRNSGDYFRFVQPDALPPEEPRVEQVESLECSENWDDEPDVKSYNPNSQCETAPILRRLDGAAPATRRAFRESQRERFRQLSQGKDQI